MDAAARQLGAVAAGGGGSEQLRRQAFRLQPWRSSDEQRGAALARAEEAAGAHP